MRRNRDRPATGPQSGPRTSSRRPCRTPPWDGPEWRLAHAGLSLLHRPAVSGPSPSATTASMLATYGVSRSPGDPLPGDRAVPRRTGRRTVVAPGQPGSTPYHWQGEVEIIVNYDSNLVIRAAGTEAIVVSPEGEATRFTGGVVDRLLADAVRRAALPRVAAAALLNGPLAEPFGSEPLGTSEWLDLARRPRARGRGRGSHAEPKSRATARDEGVAGQGTRARVRHGQSDLAGQRRPRRSHRGQYVDRGRAATPR